jgi:hypothetical protein
LAYAFGGGLFQDIYPKDYAAKALVGPTWETARRNEVSDRHDIPQIIDYHAVLEPGDRWRSVTPAGRAGPVPAGRPGPRYGAVTKSGRSGISTDLPACPDLRSLSTLQESCSRVN